MHSHLLLTHEQPRGEDYALVQLNLQATVTEEYPVVRMRMSVSTTEWYTPIYNEPFALRSYLRIPSEDPLSEGGIFAKMTVGNSAYLKKIDILYEDDDGNDWGAATSSEAGVGDAYFTSFQMGPDIEVACQPLNGFGTSELGIVDLYTNIQDPGTNNPEYYRLRVENTTGSTDTWTISYVAPNGSVTQLATTTPVSHYDWDWIMFRRAGNTLSAWRGYYQYPNEWEPDPDYPGTLYGPWEFVLSVTDTTLTEQGYVGFGADGTGQIANFYAGDAYTDKQDAATINLDISLKSQEGIPGQAITFDFADVDDWEYYQTVASPTNLHYTISTAHATDGATSLKVRYETEYPLGDFLFQWRDFINGGSTSTTYWLSYTFMVEDWAQLEKNGVAPNGGIYLPGMQSLNGFTNKILSQPAAPYAQSLSSTTGQVGLAGTSTVATAGVWHSLQLGMSDDGVNRTMELWMDNSLVKSVSDTNGNLTTSVPYGISFGNENTTGGAVWIDQMKWSFGTRPTAPTTTETATGLTTEQWVKIREKASGLNAAVGIEIDPTYTNQVTEAWVYADIYIPQDMLVSMDNNDSRDFLGTDFISFQVKAGFDNPRTYKLQTYVDGSLSGTAIDLVTNFVGDRWINIEYYHDVGTSQVDVWVDGNQTVIPLNMTYPSYWRPEGFNYVEVWSPTFFSGTRGSTDWVGVDNLAYSTKGRVSDWQYDYWWSFEGIDALNEANTNYPNPPFYAQFGPGGDVTTLEEGMQGGGTGPPIGNIDFTLTPTASEVVGLTTVGIVYNNLTAISGTTFFDSYTLPVKMSVLGGECYTTFTADQFGEGEVSLRWYGTDNDRWGDEDNVRWIGTPTLAESVHC